MNIFSSITDITKQIYMFWGNAVKNNSAQAKKEIDKLLERNAVRLVTKQYPKEAYRARIVEPKDYPNLVIGKQSKISGDQLFSGNSGIHGFLADNMGPPPIEKINNGRANKEKNPCLYLASDIQTACSEVQPCFESLISAIKFSLNLGMSLIDLRNLPKNLRSYNSKEDMDKLIDIIFCQSLLYFFSTPVSSKDEDIYKFSQYVAEYFSTKNIDGILYLSSHNYNNDAYNIVLFDPTKATINEEYGELFKCLSIKTTFQSLSNKYRNENDITILESKRERDPLLWHEILLLYKELIELQ